MKINILKALRDEAKSWWHNQELRKRGRILDASSREADQIRRNASTLREVLANKDRCYVTRGSGITLHMTGYKTIECPTRDLDNFPVAKIAVECGVTLIDYLSYTGDDIVSVILNAPIPRPDLDNDEVNTDTPFRFRYVTTATYIEYMENHGVPVTRNHHKG